MPVDLDEVREALARTPVTSPYPLELTAAIVGDVLRDAGWTPIPEDRWRTWRSAEDEVWEARVGLLAHALVVSAGLREATVAALAPSQTRSFEARMRAFFERTAPIAPEMIRAQPMRQEEFLRHWTAVCKMRIAGETQKESQARLAQLDYRKALEEVARAKAQRKKEAAARAEARAEAQRKQAAARGWRE